MTRQSPHRTVSLLGLLTTIVINPDTTTNTVRLIRATAVAAGLVVLLVGVSIVPLALLGAISPIAGLVGGTSGGAVAGMLWTRRKRENATP